MEQILSILCSEANYYGTFQGHSLAYTNLSKGEKRLRHYDLKKELNKLRFVEEDNQQKSIRKTTP